MKNTLKYILILLSLITGGEAIDNSSTSNSILVDGQKITFNSNSFNIAEFRSGGENGQGVFDVKVDSGTDNIIKDKMDINLMEVYCELPDGPSFKETRVPTWTLKPDQVKNKYSVEFISRKIKAELDLGVRVCLTSLDPCSYLLSYDVTVKNGKWRSYFFEIGYEGNTPRADFSIYFNERK